MCHALSPFPQPEATMGLASYYTYGLPTFTVVVIALYLLFTGNVALHFSFVATFAEIRRCRLGRSIQRWPVSRRDESLCVGLDWNWVVHWSQCSWCRMVHGLFAGMSERKLMLAAKGNLRYWLFDSRWWCTSTPDTDQEPDQVSLRVFRGILFAYAFTVSFSAKLLQFTVLCAASVFSIPQSPHYVALDHWYRLLGQIDLCPGFRNVHSR